MPRTEARSRQEPIKRRKLYHEVFDRLMAGVRQGAYPVGSTLPPERELVEQFSVGRPAIREALQAMERMGVIAIQHGDGARVLPISATTIIGQMSDTAVHLLASSQDLLDHLKEARLLFEVSMGRALALQGRSANLVPLERALEACAASQQSGEDFQKADMRFHRTIAELSGNPIYAAISQAMLDWLGQFYSHLVSSPGTEALIVEEHTTIFRAIAAADPDKTALAITEHLTRANPSYRVRKHVKA